MAKQLPEMITCPDYRLIALILENRTILTESLIYPKLSCEAHIQYFSHSLLGLYRPQLQANSNTLRCFVSIFSTYHPELLVFLLHYNLDRTIRFVHLLISY